MRTGIDIGGTKIEAAVLGPDDSIAWRRRVPAPRTYDACLDALTALVSEADAHAGGRPRVGIGFPGFVDDDGMACHAFSTPLIGHRLADDLARRIARPVRADNDANCFVLAESTVGAARGRGVVFGVTLGTGAGAGLAIGGRVHRGANGVAGEWGHVPLPWMSADEYPGPSCGCGRVGCIEQFVSGTALARDHARMTGVFLEATEIGARAAAGDRDCTASLARLRDRLARALAIVVNILDPDAFVVGGGLGQAPGLVPGLSDEIARHAFAGRCRAPVLAARLGASAGVVGAALLGAS